MQNAVTCWLRKANFNTARIQSGPLWQGGDFPFSQFYSTTSQYMSKFGWWSEWERISSPLKLAFTWSKILCICGEFAWKSLHIICYQFRGRIKIGLSNLLCWKTWAKSQFIWSIWIVLKSCWKPLTFSRKLHNQVRIMNYLFETVIKCIN